MPFRVETYCPDHVLAGKPRFSLDAGDLAVTDDIDWYVVDAARAPSLAAGLNALEEEAAEWHGINRALEGAAPESLDGGEWRDRRQAFEHRRADLLARHGAC